MKTGRTVIITGAAGGMGSILVRRFVDNGDTVIATDTSRAALDALADSIGDDRLRVEAADITRDADIETVAALAKDTTGRVDVLVNAAGFFPVQPFLEMSPDDWRRVVDINLTGPALMARAVLPSMVGRGWGRIVNIGSGSIYVGVPGQVHYVSAKAGNVGLTRSLAREFGGEGITVNLVAPGVTVNPSAPDALPAALRSWAIEARSLKRAQEPDDVTGAVFFLASPEADFITGQTLIVDGGSQMV